MEEIGVDISVLGISICYVFFTFSGDLGVGKTCFIKSYAVGEFYETYVPKRYDDFLLKKSHSVGTLNVTIFDYAVVRGYEDTIKYRDITIFCYSCTEKASLDSLKDTWLKEFSESDENGKTHFSV